MRYTLFIFTIFIISLSKSHNPTLPFFGTNLSVSLPSFLDWRNNNGINYLTKITNQYNCGSCWAHTALSVLADRIKIIKIINNNFKEDINLSVQFLLNCGQSIGSCNGGYPDKAWQFIKNFGYIPFDECVPYIACSKNFTGCEDKLFDKYIICKPNNICEKCQMNPNICTNFPNATVDSYGRISNNIISIKQELLNGPVSCILNFYNLMNYTKGIFMQRNIFTTPNNYPHAISIIGWGKSDENIDYWIGRNSWSEFWGENGFFRIEAGKNLFGIEDHCSWVKPGSWTEY